MDIQLQSAAPIKKYAFFAFISLITALTIYLVVKPTRPSFDASELTFTTAEQGPLDIYVNSFGKIIYEIIFYSNDSFCKFNSKYQS